MASSPANILGALILCLSTIIILPHTALAAGGTLGINYGRVANNLPTPLQVVNLLQRNNAKNVKIYDTNRQVITAFTGTGITLVIELTNKQIIPTANSQLYSDNWVRINILPFYPATNITTVAVGNEVTRQQSALLNRLLVPAMRNLHTSLMKFNLQNAIKISSPFPLDVLAGSYPPSSGRFRPELINPVIKPLLKFLDDTSSFFMINIYPFVTYAKEPENIPLEYALSEPGAKGITDPGTGLHYSSLFEAQIDALNFAISALGGIRNRNLLSSTGPRRQLRTTTTRVVVTETGWPSAGSRSRRRSLLQQLVAVDESSATKQNAAKYNGNLINRVLTGKGTPWVPDEPLEVYIFSLFNENLKRGPTSERNFGLFYPSGRKVYNVSITGTDWWCVAKTGMAKEKLQQGLDYACAKNGGGVDCSPIKPGGKCYQPNTLMAHASWAFSTYYRLKAKIGGTCDFGGAAFLTSDKPGFGYCELPSAAN